MYILLKQKQQWVVLCKNNMGMGGGDMGGKDKGMGLVWVRVEVRVWVRDSVV